MSSGVSGDVSPPNASLILINNEDSEDDNGSFTRRMSGMFSNFVPSFVTDLVQTPGKKLTGYFSRPRTPVAEDITFGANEGDLMEVDEEEEEEEEEEEVAQPTSSSSSSSSKKPALSRQWTHSFDDGSEESRLHRKQKDEKIDEKVEKDEDVVMEQNDEDEADEADTEANNIPEGAGVGIPIGSKLNPPTATASFSSSSSSSSTSSSLTNKKEKN